MSESPAEASNMKQALIMMMCVCVLELQVELGLTEHARTSSAPAGACAAWTDPWSDPRHRGRRESNANRWMDAITAKHSHRVPLACLEQTLKHQYSGSVNFQQLLPGNRPFPKVANQVHAYERKRISSQSEGTECCCELKLCFLTFWVIWKVSPHLAAGIKPWCNHGNPAKKKKKRGNNTRRVQWDAHV